MRFKQWFSKNDSYLLRCLPIASLFVLSVYGRQLVTGGFGEFLSFIIQFIGVIVISVLLIYAPEGLQKNEKMSNLKLLLIEIGFFIALLLLCFRLYW